MKRLVWVALLASLNMSLSAARAQDSELITRQRPERKVDWPEPSLGPTIRFSEQEKEQQRMAAESLLKNLEHAIASGARQFIIPPGHYRFDTGVRKGILLENVHDFTLLGKGATLWFDQRYGIQVRHCTNVTLDGFVFDMDPLPFVQGRIDSIDPVAHTLDVTLEPGYEVPTEHLNSRRPAFFFDKMGRVLNYDMDGGSNLMQAIGPNRLRLSKFGASGGFQNNAKPRSAIVGDRVVIGDSMRGVSSAIHMAFSKNIAVQNITMYASTGFAFSESSGPGGDTYRNVRLIRRPGTNRLMADMSDCLHSNLMEKGPLIENCEFSAAGDDLINIHGMFSMVVQNIDGHELLIASVFKRAILPNSYLHFYHAPTCEPTGEAIVTQLEYVTDPSELAKAKTMIAKLSSTTETGVRTFDGLELVRVKLNVSVNCSATDLACNYDTCGEGVTIRNNYFHDSHSRAILLRSKNALVENNRIERITNAAIAMTPELYYLEGPFLYHVKISGNHILDTDWQILESPPGRPPFSGSIYLCDNFLQKDQHKVLLRGHQNQEIEISNNEIVESGAPGIVIANGKDITISNNVIKRPFAAGQCPIQFDWSILPASSWHLSPEQQRLMKNPYYGIFLFSCDPVTAEGNKIIDAPGFLRGEIGYGPN